MTISHEQKGQYHIFSVQEDLTLNSNIKELYSLIHTSLEKGKIDIALCFTKKSYLSTGTITVLVNCFEDVRNHKGNLAIIDPNEDILDVLSMIDLDKMVKFYPSVSKLVEQTAPVGSIS